VRFSLLASTASPAISGRSGDSRSPEVGECMSRVLCAHSLPQSLKAPFQTSSVPFMDDPGAKRQVDARRQALRVPAGIGLRVHFRLIPFESVYPQEVR